MQLHQLQPKTTQKTSKRIGRGRGSGRGKTAGRGTKGQKARAGHRIWPNVREQLKKIPKLRGRGVHGLTSIQAKPAAINLTVLEKAFSSGDAVNPKVLIERGLLRAQRGQVPAVKILGGLSSDKAGSPFTKKLIVSGCKVSQSARAVIEKAGGSIQ